MYEEQRSLRRHLGLVDLPCLDLYLRMQTSLDTPLNI